MDKIRTHPQYNTISSSEKMTNKQTLRAVIPRAEELKKQLLEQYQDDLDKYLTSLKERERIEKERLRQEELQKEEEERRNKLAALTAKVKAMKAANVVIPEEIKSKPPPTIISPSNDDKIPKTSKDM